MKNASTVIDLIMCNKSPSLEAFNCIAGNLNKLLFLPSLMLFMTNPYLVASSHFPEYSCLIGVQLFKKTAQVPTSSCKPSPQHNVLYYMFCCLLSVEMQKLQYCQIKNRAVLHIPMLKSH